MEDLDYFALVFALGVTLGFVLMVLRYTKRKEKRDRDTSVISNFARRDRR